MSTFFGFNIARSGLFTAQKALDVVSHNIANAETPGYSRQRVEQYASSPIGLAGGKGMIGTGVDSTAVTQIRNEFLDLKFRGENTSYGQWQSRYDSLSQIEAIMNEPSESGIRSVMDDFFSSVQELSKDASSASSLTTRAVLRERGIALSNTLNHMYSQFEKMTSDIDFEIESTVDQINTYANDISKLNEQIFRSEIGGNKANDLRDQRNLLMDELSKLVNVEVTEISDGTDKSSGKMVLSINGQPLVHHEKAYKLSVDVKAKHKIIDNIEVGQLQWDIGTDSNGNPIEGSKIDTSILKGTLKAQLDMRDNIDGDNKGIPYYLEKLNEFTTRFAAEFNAQHYSGYGLGDAGSEKLFFQASFMVKDTGVFTSGTGVPTTGTTHDPKSINLTPTMAPAPTSIKDFVDKYAKDPYNKTEESAIEEWEEKYKGYTIAKDDSGNWYETSTISAKDIKISNDIESDLDNIAAAKLSKDGEGLPGDPSNMLALGNIRHDNKMFTWGSPDDFVKSLISNLGVDTQTAQRMAGNQEVLINQIEMQKESVSGVSLDEEMTNMVKFQHAYSAAARMITTIDEMIDVLINRMGRVGL